MMMTSQVFKGANVFMSRNLVPPELFDALLDALKHKGAEIFLCSDPSRNGSNDFHVISSPDHEKFEDLRSKGCNLLGPQCVLSCAKENRPLPKQGFICCLAMDGLKILLSGFQMDEKVKIGKLVTAMGGVLQTRASSDVNFVIVKNVLAAKYKWALNIQKKPIVTINWLYQCWTEHRVVPQESYRVPPFSGLTICITQIPADERKQIEKLITENGGKYSAELTKKCTHLIANSAEGDKFKVARKWGNIHIVARKWFDQCLLRRACLGEESYPVQDGSAFKAVRASSFGQNSQEKIRISIASSQSAASEPELSAYPSAWVTDSEIEASVSQRLSSMSGDYLSTFGKERDGEAPSFQPLDGTNFDSHVANDSQSEDNDLYLSECRIYLTGFEAAELRKLVSLVRRGGGSRYMLPNDKLTHIIVGTPSEIEKKQARSFAASGVIQVVRAKWLEDCCSKRKEIPVSGMYTAYDLILPKDSVHSTKGVGASMITAQSKSNVDHHRVPVDKSLDSANAATGFASLLHKNTEEKLSFRLNLESSKEATVISSSQKKSLLTFANCESKSQQKLLCESSVRNLEERKSSVFKGRKFCFSNSFPEDRQAEIVQWVNQGGGEMVNSTVNDDVHFTIECHGTVPLRTADIPQTTYVSSHWVRSCLEEGCLLDIGSHIIYSPLSCQTPLPGFQNFRFCVSQYDEKDRLLLKNLCFILGAKFVEKLTRKVTHLLCKFAYGAKYEAACKWGIQSVTSEWVYECVRQNQLIPPYPFSPKEVTSQDVEAGCCPASQFSLQSMNVNHGDITSQLTSQSNRHRSSSSQILGSKQRSINTNRNDAYRENGRPSRHNSKKAKLIEDSYQENAIPSNASPIDFQSNVRFDVGIVSEVSAEVAPAVPDVAAAIEDLLEQTSKIQDEKSSGSIIGETNLSPSNCIDTDQEIAASNPVSGLSTHWLNLTLRKDDDCTPCVDATPATFGGFSETQTDSQIVGYEDDLSGRQMLIEKVRNRSSLR